MAFTFRLTPDQVGLVVVAAHQVGLPETLGVSAAVLASPLDLRRVRYLIVDMSPIEHLDMHNRDVLATAEAHHRLAGPCPVLDVVLIAPEDLGFGMSRLYAQHVLAPGWTVHVARTSQGALAWLAQRGHAVDALALTVPC